MNKRLDYLTDKQNTICRNVFLGIFVCCLIIAYFTILGNFTKYIYFLLTFIIVYLALNFALSYVHEVCHQLMAEFYNYETKIIMGKGQMELAGGENKNRSAYCDFNCNDIFEYNSLRHIYLAPLYFLISCTIICILCIFVAKLEFIDVFFGSLVFIFIFKMYGCRGDISAILRLLKYKGKIKEIYYDRGFYIKVD